MRRRRQMRRLGTVLYPEASMHAIARLDNRGVHLVYRVRRGWRGRSSLSSRSSSVRSLSIWNGSALASRLPCIRSTPSATRWGLGKCANSASSASILVCLENDDLGLRTIDFRGANCSG